MKAFNIIEAGKGPDSWSRVDVADPTPGPGQVLIEVKAVSLNTRDLMVASGYFPIPPKKNVIPVSDGAGEIIAVGAGVTRWSVGDRVFGSYYQHWHDGQFPADAELHALGGPLDGMLGERVTLPASGVVRVPDHLTYEEASTLPVAALTAWNAVMETVPRMNPGATLLTLGTGGVSLFAIQFAQASGFRVIATTSSEEKVSRLRALGVADVVNYKETPDWEQEVLRLTNGHGVDQVIEVGGTGTLPKSLKGCPLWGGGELDWADHRLQRPDRYLADSLQEDSTAGIWGRVGSDCRRDGPDDRYIEDQAGDRRGIRLRAGAGSLGQAPGPGDLRKDRHSVRVERRSNPPWP